MLPFGETVLSWRLARGMSQAALAQAARMSRPNLSAVERGDREVTLGTLRRLALALGVRPGVLADGEPPTPMSEPVGRAALERIAHAARCGAGARNEGEQRLGALLAAAASTRILGHDEPRTATANRRRSTRNAERAYLMLKSTTTPAVVASLVDRLRGGGE